MTQQATMRHALRQHAAAAAETPGAVVRLLPSILLTLLEELHALEAQIAREKQSAAETMAAMEGQYSKDQKELHMKVANLVHANYWFAVNTRKSYHKELEALGLSRSKIRTLQRRVARAAYK